MDAAFPLFNQIVDILDEGDSVAQQIVIELLITRHVRRVGLTYTDFVLDGITKHVRQFLKETNV